ncbi:uncharacterized protein LOC111543961 [Piliocolobus tephrosceles]|uniref:uncharacterized protein LOC111543961 n=1 Tax=Piliocolobus tephrosceles TaxID=591936 RepID=UPI000C2B403B|nr:uncharacterized protein LOC111543961 [Piliocolobus tephrosceles]
MGTTMLKRALPTASCARTGQPGQSCQWKRDSSPWHRLVHRQKGWDGCQRLCFQDKSQGLMRAIRFRAGTGGIRKPYPTPTACTSLKSMGGTGLGASCFEIGFDWSGLRSGKRFQGAMEWTAGQTHTQGLLSPRRMGIGGGRGNTSMEQHPRDLRPPQVKPLGPCMAACLLQATSPQDSPTHHFPIAMEDGCRGGTCLLVCMLRCMATRGKATPNLCRQASRFWVPGEVWEAALL